MEMKKKTVVIIAVFIVLALYNLYSLQKDLKQDPDEFNSTVEWKMDEIAYNNNIRLERVEKIQDVFTKSRGLGGAGGQGTLIITCSSPQQLADKAQNSTLYYEYNVKRGGELNKKYVFPISQVTFEWSESTT